MKFRKITAIVRRNALEAVEKRLREDGVQGISVSHVKGWGEYANFFSRDWLVTHAKIEIFTTQASAEPIIQLILESAQSGTPGDGIIAITPIEEVFRIRTKSRAKAGQV